MILVRLSACWVFMLAGDGWCNGLAVCFCCSGLLLPGCLVFFGREFVLSYIVCGCLLLVSSFFMLFDYYFLFSVSFTGWFGLVLLVV